MKDDEVKEEYRALFLSLYPDEKERFQSKSQLVREMFEDIEKARQNGVKLVALHSVIKQKSQLEITYNEFKQIIYRIRKERGITVNRKRQQTVKQVVTEPLSDNVAVESKVSTLNQEESDLSFLDNPQKATGKQLTAKNWQLIVDKYNKCQNNEERWLCLGGDMEEFKYQSETNKKKYGYGFKSKIKK
ncbi:hypothetical protein JCM19233_2450 [Vibrio astriarenae]|nr:hypothetical protein JCM19233_2450 [Vibrio sp. C7]